MGPFTTLFALFALATGVSSETTGDGLVICLLMMARNEETLIRRHLTSWLPLLSPSGCIVGQVDDRSTDGSHSAFLDETVVPLSAVPFDRRHVYHYSFDGLGPARSLLLHEADAKFGATATHYFIADPDWRFDIAPHQSVKTVRKEIGRSMKTGKDELIQAFKIYDRNGASSRWLDWFVRARQGLKFKYRWHEMLDVKPEDYTYSVLESFTVTETEGESESYHKDESGGSGTVARFLREIALLEKDLIDFPEDTRVLYYLGVDHSSVLSLLKQSAIGIAGHDAWRSAVKASEFKEHWEAAVGYFRRRVWTLWADADKQVEMAWAAALWLGRCLHDLAPIEGSFNDEAIRAFDRCIEVDPERVECRLQKVRLLVQMGDVSQAWEIAQEAETIPVPERTFLQVPYHYSCTVFAVAAQAAIANNLAEEGRRLLSAAGAGCPNGIYDESPSFLRDLEIQLENVERGGRSTLGAKSSVTSIANGQEVGGTKRMPPSVSSLDHIGRTKVPATVQAAPTITSAPSISSAVKGIRAARASSGSTSSTMSPGHSRVSSEDSTLQHSVISSHNEFIQIANRWLELAKHTSNGEEKANLIAKALLAHPSSETLERLGEILQTTCSNSPLMANAVKSGNSRQPFVEQLREKELEVAALIQKIARTPQ